jgi:hypothetical protein
VLDEAIAGVAPPECSDTNGTIRDAASPRVVSAPEGASTASGDSVSRVRPS